MHLIEKNKLTYIVIIIGNLINYNKKSNSIFIDKLNSALNIL